MRDDFSFPVFVGYELMNTKSGIKGVDPNKRIAGQLTRSHGATYLDLADAPEKKMYQHNNGITYNNNDKVISNGDTNNWYATSWDGSRLFILRKFFNVDSKMHFAYNHFSEETTKWLITDFEMVSQFMLTDEVYQAKLYMDHIFSWFRVYNPNQDLSKVNSIEYNDLIFQEKKLKILVRGEGNQKQEIHSIIKTVNLTMCLLFEDSKNRQYIYQIAVALRNMFQIIINKRIGISRIILNRINGDKLIQSDERENWFIEQSYLPEESKEIISDVGIPYASISSNFNTILKQYLEDEKLQNLVNSFLLVDQFQIPIATAIITLVSGIETYYNQTKYKNGKTIGNAHKKLQRFLALLDNSSEIVQQEIPNLTVDELITRMRDSRDYFIHGDKADRFVSEAELVPYLIVFKKLYQQILAKLIVLDVKKNN